MTTDKNFEDTLPQHPHAPAAMNQEQRSIQESSVNTQYGSFVANHNPDPRNVPLGPGSPAAPGVIYPSNLAGSAPTSIAPNRAATPNPYSPPLATVADGEIQGIDLFSPSGRIGRMRWIVYLFYSTLIIFPAVFIIAPFSYIFKSAIPIYIGEGLFIAVMMVLTVIWSIKRVHDLNWTGWMTILMFVPFVNNVIGIFLMFVPGTDGPNRFGPKPQENSKSIKTGFIIYMILIGLVVLAYIVAIVLFIGLGLNMKG